MSNELRVRRPRPEFERRREFVCETVDDGDSLATALARLDNAQAANQAKKATDPPAAFYYYARILTIGGGLRIEYSDQRVGPLISALRLGAWAFATGGVLCWLSSTGNLSMITGGGAAVILGSIVGCCKIRKRHSIEIRPDGMIVDGRFFSVEGFEDNWPQLQMKGEDENRLVLCGRYGTRFIEFVTANRIDKNDRMPERLAEDLELAMKQLWGRRDAMVPSDF